MIALLTRLFVKHPDDVKSPAVRRAYGTMVSVVCILLNIALFIIKLVAGALSGSISIRADAVNNLSDAGASLISMVSFRISAKPADRDHPFGHARMEYVASMLVSFLILFIGTELIRSSVEKLLAPVMVEFHLLTVILLSVSILCKLWISLFNRRIGKRIGSEVMRATAIDSLSDAGATAAVLVANLSTLVLPAHISIYIDPVMGILVAILIFVAGFRVLNETKNSILGEAPSEEIVALIRRVVGEHETVLGIHDMIVHNYGPGRIFASLHIEVDGKEDFFVSHDTADCIERCLREEHHIECTIHLDPIVTDDPLLDEWHATACLLAGEIDPQILLHDFRMVPGHSHTNLIFDLAVPFELALSDDEIKRLMAEKIAAKQPNFFTVITVDRL